MSHIAQRMLQMKMLTERCQPLVGPRATAFLMETIPMLDWLDQARHAFRDKYKTAPFAEQVEDAFLEYFTKTQLHCLRHILDQDMIHNDKRKEAVPYVVATLGGMTLMEAHDAMKRLGNEVWLEALLVPEQPKENTQ